MKKVALINVVGLSERLIGDNTPFLKLWSANRQRTLIDPMLPGVTCPVQTTYLTGKSPSSHGIVANGWYFRDECEVRLWRQSNHLVQAPSIWDNARKIDPAFTCANMFWWYNMYSTVDFSVTPRPQYRVDGLKIPDCYTHPATLRDRLQGLLGIFPLFDFWGPRTSIKSSKWIADASKLVYQWHHPDLLLVYLPHLDYCLQKFGPDQSLLVKDLLAIDEVIRDLVTYLEKEGVEVNLISEYGIVPVNNPIHINRILREAGLITIREENSLELLDPGASSAFAVADHQIAHVYVNDLSRIDTIMKLLREVPGIAEILDAEGKKRLHLDHSRSGELVAVANPESWFTYYYWLEDKKAPDFARTVDIHKKPGYDPVEMFLDPQKKWMVPRVGLKLLAKKLGFRTVMDLIPLDASLIQGSHGQILVEDQDRPVFIHNQAVDRKIKPTAIHDLLIQQIFG